MKNRYIILSILLMLALLTAVVMALPKFDVQSQSTASSYVEKVFVQNKVSKVDIQLEESDLQLILDNPTEKEVVPATVVVNGTEVQDVGFRVKGNMTLHSVAQSDSDRYSFKIDFDYYNDGQNLYGLQKLALNNNYSDSTFSREYLSYKLMDEMGIATPANSYMYVTINGEEYGLYLGVEAIDETFLANDFDDATGDLYKPDGTGSDLQWISEDIEDYTGLDLKTNEETSDQSAMMKLLDVINNGGELEDVVDVDEVLRYFAVNTALVNLDHYQGSMKHNYYLYEENGMFSILPWDYNMSFGGFGGGGMGGGQGNNQEIPPMQNDQSQEESEAAMQQAGPGGGDMGAGMESNFLSDSMINFSITNPVSGTTLEERPLLNALLENDTYRERYEAYLEQIATTFFTEENMTTMTSQISALILPYVEADPMKFTTTEQFLKGISGDESLVAFATKRADSILKQLSGELMIEAEENSMQPNNNQAAERPNAFPGNGQLPEGMEDEGFPADFQPPGDGQRPNGMNEEGGFPANGQPPEMGTEDALNGSVSAVDRQTLLLSGGSVGLLVTALILVWKFRRRGI